MKKTIRIIIVEDHPAFRETLEYVIKKEPDFELIGKFGNAESALRELAYDKPKSKVDVILLDLDLPGLSGLEAMPWFNKYCSNTHIIILTQSDKEADILKAIELGASGYRLKSSTMKQIITGIRSIGKGEVTMDPKLAKFIFKTINH